jgi:alanine racemase
MTHSRPAWMDVDLGAIEHNYLNAVRLAGPGRQVIAAVKGNAYGHGVVDVAKALDRHGIYAFWTGHVPEALAMRRAGIQTKIIMFGGYVPETISELVENDLVPTIYDDVGFDQAVKAGNGKPVPVYVKVDAGLGRLGVSLENARAFVHRIADCSALRLEGIYTHLPFKDEAGEAWALGRSKLFAALLDDLRRDGVEPPVTQLWGSSGFLAGLPDPTNAVCLGHILYGLSPLNYEVPALAGFRRACGRLSSRLISVARHAPGDALGVLGLYQTAQAITTGVVSFGLGDGLRRAVNGGTIQVLVRGQHVPVVGFSLEHAVVDLSGVAAAQVGDEVVLFGREGNVEISLQDWAEWFGCGPMEVIINFGGRVEMNYATS